MKVQQQKKGPVAESIYTGCHTHIVHRLGVRRQQEDVLDVRPKPCVPDQTITGCG